MLLILPAAAQHQIWTLWLHWHGQAHCGHGIKSVSAAWLAESLQHTFVSWDYLLLHLPWHGAAVSQCRVGVNMQGAALTEEIASSEQYALYWDSGCWHKLQHCFYNMSQCCLACCSHHITSHHDNGRSCLCSVTSQLLTGCTHTLKDLPTGFRNAETLWPGVNNGALSGDRWPVNVIVFVRGCQEALHPSFMCQLWKLLHWRLFCLRLLTLPASYAMHECRKLDATLRAGKCYTGSLEQHVWCWSSRQAVSSCKLTAYPVSWSFPVLFACPQLLRLWNSSAVSASSSPGFSWTS